MGWADKKWNVKNIVRVFGMAVPSYCLQSDNERI